MVVTPAPSAACAWRVSGPWVAGLQSDGLVGCDSPSARWSAVPPDSGWCGIAPFPSQSLERIGFACASCISESVQVRSAEYNVVSSGHRLLQSAREYTS